MQENSNKDPAIKLFGKKIALPTDVDSPANSSDENSPSSRRLREEIIEKDYSLETATEGTQEIDAPAANSEERGDTETASESTVNPQTPAINEESAQLKASKSENEQNDAKSSQEKSPVKKPDKILPCPRCKSMDTKFCYYNNYNVNQPRHFCKACQRYWTAGGTMRNVPIGAGRRKTKSSASQYHHITISEALQAAGIDAPNGTQHPMLKSNGRVLSFGLDAPICDSMATVLNLADKKVLNGSRNGFHTLNESRVPCKGGEKGDDCSSVSSVTVSNSMEGGTTHSENLRMYGVNGFAPPIPCLPGVPWPPYPWNSALPGPLPPAFCPPGYPPLSFYPAPYWNCGVPGAWNIPVLSPQSPASVNQKAMRSSPTSILGKHSRDSDTVKPNDMEKEEPSKHKNGCVLVPKTLRIDDPNEAAKSSIWATLGIKNESISGSALLKGLQPKSDEKNNLSKASPVLRANPAALSRSVDFHERS